jgi:hypothetical protein
MRKFIGTIFLLLGLGAIFYQINNASSLIDNSGPYGLTPLFLGIALIWFGAYLLLKGPRRILYPI